MNYEIPVPLSNLPVQNRPSFIEDITNNNLISFFRDTLYMKLAVKE